MIHQKRKQIKLLCRKALLVTVYKHTACSLIYLYAAYLHDIIFRLIIRNKSLIPRKVSLYSRNELARRKGLRHIIVSACAQSPYLVYILFLCRNHDNRYVFFASDLLAYLITIDSRKHYIQYDYIKILGKRRFKTAIAIFLYSHVKP